MSSVTEKRKKDLEALKNGYNIYVRVFEIASIIGYLVLMGVVFWEIKGMVFSSPWVIIISCLGGWVFSDLLSGVLHWFFDTWGRYNWPVVGKLLVRPFLEHHINPKSITEHDWIETNGSCFFAGIAILGSILYFEMSPVILSIAFFGCSWGCLTNQFHKWSHINPSELPKWVLFLQKTGLVLSKENHDKHHRGEYIEHYCITNGFLNPIYDKVGLFRILEKLISKITGLKPRDNELPN